MTYHDMLVTVYSWEIRQNGCPASLLCGAWPGRAMVNLYGLMANLHDLASKGDVEGVRKFLKKSAAKVNDTNREGQTALHLGAKGGHVEVCRELVAFVAAVDVGDSKHVTPLLVAVANNKANVAQVLCEAGASTSSTYPADGRTPLHLAANKGFVECAEILLQHGAPIDEKPNKWGHLPEDECSVSEIRNLIQAARRDRAAMATAVVRTTPSTSPYNPHAASAPPPTEELEGDAAHPSYASSPERPLPHSSSTEEGKGERPVGKALSPLSQALKAAKLGGDRCAGCDSPERSRQLTPCHHVVCGACARRARDEEERGCPVCCTHVFDDNPVFM